MGPSCIAGGGNSHKAPNIRIIAASTEQSPNLRHPIAIGCDEGSNLHYEDISPKKESPPFEVTISILPANMMSCEERSNLYLRIRITKSSCLLSKQSNLRHPIAIGCDEAKQSTLRRRITKKTIVSFQSNLVYRVSNPFFQ